MTHGEIMAKLATERFREKSHAFLSGGMTWCSKCRAYVHSDETTRREDGDTYCEACDDADRAYWEAQFAWMKPHVARAEAARRAGDIETAEAIKHDVLRHDSPFDPRRIA